MSKLELFTDGSTRPTNPGPSGYGAALFRDDEMVATSSGYLGDSVTNNQAEYSALVAGLFMAEEYIDLDDKELIVRSDSMLVINQVLGEWKLASGNLQHLHARARSQVLEFRTRGVEVVLEHVKGHSGVLGNETVDRLAVQAVAKQDDPMPWLRALITGDVAKMVSPEPILPELKGHEKLKELVTIGLEGLGHQVMVGPSVELVRARDDLRGTGDTGSIMAYFPDLLTIMNGKTYLLSLSTGYRMKPPEQGSLTVDKGALEACRTFAKAGLTVLMLHRPHGSGRWKKPYDLGWSDDMNDIPIMCFEMDKIVVTGEYTVGDWPNVNTLDLGSGQKFTQYLGLC